MKIRQFFSFSVIWILTAVLITLSAASSEENKKFPILYTGKLPDHQKIVARTEIDTHYLQERVADLLKDQKIGENDYQLQLFSESGDLVIRAGNEKIRDQVLEILRNVEKYYYTVIQTKTIALHYANAVELAELLSNIYNPKTYIQQDDGQFFVKRDPSGIDISPDNRTNSIVVTAPLNLINNLQETVASLDRHTTQVLIKVLIAEVSLDENNQFGVEWNFTDGTFLGNDASKGKSVVDFGYQSQTSQDDLLGLKYSVLSADRLKALLQMLKTTSKIDVLSSPQLVTSDNSHGYFQESVRIPVLKTTATATGVISTSVEYQEIGIKLEVTPKINVDDYIKLDVEQTIQNILESATVQNAPTFSNRVVHTSVLAKDGNTVIIGGMLKNNESVTRRKVPVLGDAPLIKNAFRRNFKTSQKTELMVFITPKIIRTDKTIQETVADLNAPRLKEKLENSSRDYFALREEAGSKEIKVTDVGEDRVVINAGKADNVGNKDEFILVRPSKEYYHPQTNQLIAVDELEIGRIRIETVSDKTSICNILYLNKDEKVQPGDLVRPSAGMDFDSFKMISTDFSLKFLADRLQCGIICEVQNSTNSPQIKTEFPWKTNEVQFSIKSGEVFAPLKSVWKGDRYEIFFDNVVEPLEIINLKVTYSLPMDETEVLNEQINNSEAYARFHSFVGGSTGNYQLSISAWFRGRLILRNFDIPPAVIDNPDGSCTLVWTHLGSVQSVEGQFRYAEPEKLLKALKQVKKP
ncbi:MAG: secretin N-terminal domain-containing protein [Candidatus Wallbacteria bacterium]|nr:secretin N-terminal domain-containing protein [Candidatus Wallbacteria bacterium]